MAYRLALPPSLASVHDVFHVSMLRKYVHDPSHILEVTPVAIHNDMSYVEQPLQIVDRKLQVLRKRTIPYVKVQWTNHAEREATWELEENMMNKYPFLFEHAGKF